MAAHEKYLPQSLTDIQTLIKMYYSDPSSPFPVKDFAKFISGILPFPPRKAKKRDFRQAITSVTLLTAYSVSSWTRQENHLCVAQAWLTTCTVLMRFSVACSLDSDLWMASYKLALEAARVSLLSLVREAANAEDLVIPDPAESIIYPSRALLVCGFISAFFLSEQTLVSVDDSTRKLVRTVLTREWSHVRIVGESDVPAFIVTACALEQIGQIRAAETMMLALVRTLSTLNVRHSAEALAGPYHDTEEVLMHKLGAESDLEIEEFDGHSYMLHTAIEWLARRLLRQNLSMMWPDITRVRFVEFQPSSPDQLLSVEDEDGQLKMWDAARPQSWAKLLEQARSLDRRCIPEVLWSQREMIPYLPLLFPYRLTSNLGRAIHAIASNPDPPT